MLLSKLLEGVEVLNEYKDIEVLGLNFNTNNVKKGDMFICLKGSKTDGHSLATIAIDKGAICLLVEKLIPSLNVVQILVQNTRKALSVISSNFYYRACDKLKIVTVTGTNGKTSVTYILNSILESAKLKSAVIGTNGIKINDKQIETGLTTPDPIELHKIFNLMVKEGVEVVCMEASAHAIYLHKLHGIKAKIGIFTNCTQDHLDYFKNMENYQNVKKSYFDEKNMEFALVNVDDKLGIDIYQNSNVKTVTYGETNPSDIFSVNFENTSIGIKFLVNAFDDIIPIECNLYGRFNMYNIMAAIGAAKFLKINDETIAAGIKNIDKIDGRFNVVYNKDFKVIIDFAHTPDSLENVLKAARTITKNNLICVFGCGGNRDEKKRSIMGEIAVKYSDFCVITSDNPRFEESDKIIRQIEDGAKRITDKYILIENRKKAIAYAVNSAQRYDTVIICGKGAENYMEIAGIKHPYSDYEVVNSLIE